MRWRKSENKDPEEKKKSISTKGKENEVWETNLKSKKDERKQREIERSGRRGENRNKGKEKN